MSRIKEYYIDQINAMDEDELFHWMTDEEEQEMTKELLVNKIYPTIEDMDNLFNLDSDE